ncbi:MAG: hypothetical protein ACREMB_04105 [Candidatus Rokuibacteriota bacterium]
MPDSPPLRRIPDHERHELFNRVYADRLKAGALIECLEDNKQPSPEKSGMPECTRSQYVALYEESGLKVVGGHRYILPDGSTFGSHELDPKWILHEGVVYVQVHPST